MQPQDNSTQPTSTTPPPASNSESTPSQQRVHNPLEAMRPGEHIICEIKRHPIGLLGLYASVGLVVLLVAIFGYGLGPTIFTATSRAQIFTYSTLAFAVAAFFGVVALLIGHKIYWGNRWIVTNDSVTQISQLSLFNVQSSQLSLANVEDVTSERSGLLPHLFNYGSLKAETAGERQKFKLSFCPNPDHYARLILQAREEFEHENYRITTLRQQPDQSGGQGGYSANGF